MKKPLHKRWYIWLFAFIVIAALIGQLNGGGTPKDVTAATTAPSAKPAKFDFATSQVTEVNIKAAIKDAHWNRSLTLDDKTLENVKITDGAIIDLNVKLSQTYGAQDELMQVGNTIVVISEILFTNPNVKSIGVWGNAIYNDQYGKEIKDVAAKIVWDRELAAKVVYKNFRDMTLTDFKQPFKIASIYSIHPATYKELSPDDKNGLPMMK